MTDSATKPHVPRWKTALVWIERLALLALIAFAAYRFGPQVGALTGIGPSLGRAPELSFVSLDGDTVTAADLHGEVVVLNFWATWCLPCRAEMPSLQRLHQDLGARGVRVVGLATDVGSEDPIREFLVEREITYPVGRASAAHRRAFGGIPGIPTTFIIDRDGVIRHRVVGYFAPPAMRAAVGRLLED
jgi:thiol-disulfide isomerase/thioredoxin